MNCAIHNEISFDPTLIQFYDMTDQHVLRWVLSSPKGRD